MNSKVSKLKVGDKWSRLSYGTVVVNRVGEVIIQNEKGKGWCVGASIFEDEFDTIQHTSVENITRTEMSTIVMKSARVIMSVTFRKKPDPKVLVKQIIDMIANPDAYKTKAKISKAIKEPTAGKKRTMIGRHDGYMNEQGRIDFIDMEVTNGSPLRQIDPRTIEEVVVGGVLYRLK